MNALLQRIADTPFGVFGYLDLRAADGAPQGRFCTGEDDWLDNRSQVSCIPAGLYVCRRTVHHKTGEPTFEITGVPGRSRILIHPGNTEEDVMGCVMVGTDFGCRTVPDEDAPGQPARLKWGVSGSRVAFERFMAKLAGIQQFDLQVVWAEPGAWR